MVATVKKGLAGIALTVVLLASMAFGALHVNAASLQHHASVSSSHVVAIISRPFCPPPPFDCI